MGRIGTPVRQPDDLPNLVLAILSVTIGAAYFAGLVIFSLWSR